MNKWIKIGFGICLALLLVGALWFVFGGLRQARLALAGLETEVVQRGDLEITVSADAVVRSNQSAVLTWKTSGSVERVLVEAGERVMAGQTLAELAETSLPQAVILAQVELINAQRELDRLLHSASQRAAALKTVDEARQRLEDARDPSRVQAAALEKLAAARRDLEDAELQLYILTRPVPQTALDQAYANLLMAERVLNRTLSDIRLYEQKAHKNPRNYMFWESRDLYETILESLEQKRIRDQRAYEEALERYNRLRQPPDPNDVALAQAAVELARAQLAQAEREWQRAQAGVSPGEIAVLEAEYADAVRELERWQDGPDPSKVQAAQARLQAAQAALRLPRLEAPFDGVITSVSVRPGDQVAPGSPAFRLDDTCRLLADVSVSEVDINRIQPGQPVKLTLDGIPGRVYQAVVMSVPAVGEQVQGVFSFRVVAEIRDADQALKPGMTAAATIVVSQVQDAVLVPNRALRYQEGRRIVYVLRDGQVVPVPLTLGAASQAYSQVLEGDLRPGDRVIVSQIAGLPEAVSGRRGRIRLLLRP